MSGHWRVCVATFILFVGLSVSPASSNALTDWLSNPVFEEPAAPAQRECVSGPGAPTAPGRHWMYHLEGHRKCWFEAEVAAPMQKRIHHHAAERTDDKKLTIRRMAALNAQDKLLSAPPAQIPPGPAPDVTGTAPTPGAKTATLASAAPVPAAPTSDRLATEDVGANVRLAGMVLAVASLDKEGTTTSVPRANSDARSVPDADKYRWQPVTTRLGMAAIALGLFLLVASLLASRLLGSRGA